MTYSCKILADSISETGKRFIFLIGRILYGTFKYFYSFDPNWDFVPTMEYIVYGRRKNV